MLYEVITYDALVEKHKAMLDRYEGFTYDISELEPNWMEALVITSYSIHYTKLYEINDS